MTNSSSASQARAPSTLARPWPLPARADSLPSSTSSSSTSPGLTCLRKRQPASVALVGEHRHAPQLGQRLHHENSGKRGPSGEVTGEESLVTPQVPATAGPLAGYQVVHLVDEEKGRPMRKHVFGPQHGRRGYRRSAQGKEKLFGGMTVKFCTCHVG
jgi:hypothetical protein